MSLQERAQQFDQALRQRTAGNVKGYAGEDGALPVTPIKAPASMFPQTRFGIVDGEVVEVHSQDDIPGMSPVIWVSSIKTGTYAPVPTGQCPHFATAGQAYEALQQQRNLGSATATPQTDYRR